MDLHRTIRGKPWPNKARQCRMYRHFSETSGHQRLVYAATAGAVVALLPLPLALPSQMLLAWCAGTATFLVLAWWLAVEFDAPRTRLLRGLCLSAELMASMSKPLWSAKR